MPIAGEDALPIAMADDRDVLACLILVQCEIAPELGLDAENIEVIGRNTVDVQDFGTFAVWLPDRTGRGDHRGQSGECVIPRAPVEIVRVRCRTPIRVLTRMRFKGVDGEESFRMREWQRSQKYAVNQAVDCGRRPYSESESQDCGKSEARRFAKLAKSIPCILQATPKEHGCGRFHDPRSVANP
jgi:hypothetical protein